MNASPPRLLDVEARVLAVLIEKAFTTPEQYPLSLNSTTTGCNQKSNRNPVTKFLEAEVEVALGGLMQKHLAGRVVPAGSRVEKFRHTAGETLGLEPADLAVVAELMMRGPQSPGELRARVHRMVPTPSLAELTPVLERLAARGFTRRLPPGHGSRAERHVQLLAPDLHPLGGATADGAAAPASAPAQAAATSVAAPASTGATASPLETRVTTLERELSELREKVDGLLEQLGA